MRRKFKIGGGYCKCSIHLQYKEGGQALNILVSPMRLPILTRGGQRWNNTSEIGGVING